MSFDYERNDVGDLTPDNLTTAKALAAAMILLGCMCGAALVVGVWLAISGVLA